MKSFLKNSDGKLPISHQNIKNRNSRSTSSAVKDVTPKKATANASTPSAARNNTPYAAGKKTPYAAGNKSPYAARNKTPSTAGKVNGSTSDPTAMVTALTPIFVLTSVILACNGAVITAVFTYPHLDDYGDLQAIIVCTLNLFYAYAMHSIAVTRTRYFKTTLCLILFNGALATMMVFLGTFVKKATYVVALEWIISVIGIIFWPRISFWYLHNARIAAFTTWINHLRGEHLQDPESGRNQ